MSSSLVLEKNSLGMGDRFAHQAEAQLRACLLAAQAGVPVTPVWNKSNREHVIIGSQPATTRAAVEAAVRALDWRGPYYVDADHIRRETVERFLPYADFYTIDVADWVGQPADAATLQAFIARHAELGGELRVPGIERAFPLSRAELEGLVGKYLLAVQEAGRIYRRIAAAKGPGRFITEVSMDETATEQTPPELLLILAALADQGIPVQTIAPKFAGRFNKGVDYMGDVAQFGQQFQDDLAVVAFARKLYALPANLKLSIHSGSDKFSLYPVMRRALEGFGAGVHLKTAGTTWLEELIGLAEAGGAGLGLAKEIYARALEHLEELCAPYAAVIDIDRARLPGPAAVTAWSAEQFVAALRHDPSNPAYNPHLRQLLHVGYKLAARLGPRYLEALEAHRRSVARNVTDNLYVRHLQPLFGSGTRGQEPPASRSLAYEVHS